MEKLKNITIIFLLAVGLLSSVAPGKTTSVLLQEGLYAEEITGDLDAAIKIYEQVISKSKETQRAAAQATYRIGMCFLKKGNKTKAAEYFQQIVSNHQNAKNLVEKATEQLKKISPQHEEHLPWEAMVYIYDKHMEAHKKAKSKGIGVNSHIVGVDEDFIKYPGGILTHETSNKVTAGKEIWLGNFSQAGDVEFFNEQLEPQQIRFSKRETDAIGKYMLLWKADRNMEAGEVRVIAYRSKTTDKLIATDNGYKLGFNNHYGSPVLENFFLVVPLDISIVEQSREYTTRKKFDMCEIYQWQKEVPANTTNKVDVVLERTKTVAVGNFGPVIERVINDNGEEKNWLIDFETGRLFSPSTETLSEEAFSRWIAENRIDAMGETRTSSPGLYGFDMTVMPIAAETWETISPKRYADALSIVNGGVRAVISARGKLPVTYIFKTREGGMGIIQILEMQYKKKPRYLRIRYKMLQQKLPDIETLIKELHNPEAPRFAALNKLIKIGPPAVERLITEMEKSNYWQIPKALGAIKDKRAVEPLIKKWQQCDWSPMKEVIAEALERITGKKLGQDKEKWDKWWQETKRFISPEATLRNFTAAAIKLDMNNAMEYVAGDSHDYKDIQEIFEKPGHPFNVLFRKIDPAVPVKIIETKIIDNMCEAVWQITFKEDFTIKGKTIKAGETFNIDGNLHRYGDKWLITGI